MKGLIIYFSLTGRTKLVAESIVAELSNYQVDIESIKYTKGETIQNFVEEKERIQAGDWSNFTCNDSIFDLTPYDLICIGVPTWGMRPAFIFDAYIEKCNLVNGKAFVVFTTCRLYGGSTVKKMKNEIEIKGGKVLYKKSFRAFFAMHDTKARTFGKLLNQTELR